MRAKAQYYVDFLHHGCGAWMRQGRIGGKVKSFVFAEWLSRSYPEWPVRIRYRGRIIAKLVNGKRVKMEQRRTR